MFFFKTRVFTELQRSNSAVMLSPLKFSTVTKKPSLETVKEITVE